MRISSSVSRRDLLAGIAGIGVAAAVPSHVFAQAKGRARGLPPRGEFFITGAEVRSMDPTVGHLAKGDIHIRNGAIVHRDMYSTGGFSADCTAPQTYPVAEGANVPGGSFRLVQLTSGSRKGSFINAKFAHEVTP